MQQLSSNFTLEELCRSQVARRKGIDNAPYGVIQDRLRALCVNILQPIRDHHGPVHVTSGFRSAALNEAIGGAAGSQHLRGEAADIVVTGMTPEQVCRWVQANLRNWDQCILEYDDWCHVSFTSARPNRRELLTIRHGTGYLRGIVPKDGS